MTDQPTPFENVAGGVRRALSTPTGQLLGVLGLLGFLIGLFLSLVSVGAGEGVSCGTIISPTSDTFGPAAECGNRLSVQAVRVGTLVIGGAALMALTLVGRGLARAFLILGIAFVAALLLDIREPSGGILDVLIALYALVLVVFAYNRGIRSA